MCRHLATALLLLAGIWQITRGQESLDGAGLAFWEDAWAAENANPDFQTVSCPDYRAVTAAINDFRAPYGQEPLQYSNDLEEAAKTRLAMEATTCEQSTQPLAWPGESGGTAFGLGWRAYGREAGKLSYKCVQAVNYWMANATASQRAAFRNPTGTLSADQAPSTGPLAWSVLMWGSSTQVGCALRWCESVNLVVSQYVVYCLSAPQVGEFDNDSVPAQLPAPGEHRRPVYVPPPTQRPHPPLHRHAQPIHACAPCLWGWAPSLGKPVQFEPQQSSRTLPQAASRCLPPAMGFCRRCRG